MKKTAMLLMSVWIGLLILSGCSEKGTTFTATVVNRYGEAQDAFLLTVDEGNAVTGSVIISAGAEVTFKDKDGNTITADDIAQGARVKVTYDGEILESSPAIIRNTSQVQIIE